MVEPPISHMPDGTGPSQISWKPSELLTNYERLLRLYTDELQKDEFNPYQSIPLLLLKSFSPSFQKRFWKRAALIFKVPNTLGQELVGGSIILQELERLNDQTLHAVAECNRINYRRLLQRSVFKYWPMISGIGGVFALVKTGMDIFAALPSAVWNSLSSLIWLAVGHISGIGIEPRALASNAASASGSR